MTTKTRENQPRKISLLENSIYYFLKTVLIDIQEERCRLVVVHQDLLLTDCSYKTLRGAKIAFARMYKQKAWKEGVKTAWTQPYHPEAEWLRKKLPHSFVLNNNL
jgi:hypothetical protein